MKHRLLAAPSVAVVALLLVAVHGPWRVHGQLADAGQVQFSDWSPASNLQDEAAPGVILNSAWNDQHPAISSDGLSLYITTDRPVAPDTWGGDFDLWVSHRATLDDGWGPPQHLGPNVNTTYREFAPSLSLDDHWLYFHSTRVGGCGPQTGDQKSADLYVSYREDVDDDFGWQPARNLSLSFGHDCTNGINTKYPDAGPTYFADPKTGIVSLYFTILNKPWPNDADADDGTLNDFDIFKSTLGKDGTFGPGELVEALSTPYRDTRTAIRRDGLEMFISSERRGCIDDRGTCVNKSDLWVAQRDTTLNEGWTEPQNVNHLGAQVNGPYFDGAPALSSDGTTLYFYSTRPNVHGGTDLYVTRRVQLTPGLAIAQSAAPAVVLTGSEVVYTLTVHNPRLGPATNVLVADALPPSTTFVSCVASDGGTCGGSGNDRTVAFGSIASGASATITIVATVNCPIPDGTSIANTASVTFDNPNPNLPDASATAVITASNPPPAISGAAAAPSSLWPPNHQMTDVAISYDVTDNCGPVACALSVTSNEPIDGLGDGETSPDWEIVDAHHLRLRSERAGGGEGRIYTVTITCTDTAGGTSAKTVIVGVPKSRR